MPKVQTAKVCHLLHAANGDGFGLLANLEAGNRPSGRCVNKWCSLRIQHVERLASQAVEQQLAHQASVVDVHPLGAGDECAVVAAAPVLCRRKEEVDMQARKPTRLHSPASRRLKEPSFPLRCDLMVPHIRRIAQEERGPVDRGKFQSSVFTEPDDRTIAKTHHCQVCAQHQGCQRVDV